MSDIKFRSDIAVQLAADNCSGSDESIAFAAWAIPPADPLAWGHLRDVEEKYGKDATPEGLARVLRACMKLKHNSPFEHGLMSVYCEQPGVVWWQLTRQRFMSLDTEDFSFNLESGRYKHLDPEFYVPPRERFLVEGGRFKPMRPHFESDDDTWARFVDYQRHNCLCCWENYTSQIDYGVAREVARMVLPNWALYCDGYVTARPLTWLQFFSKRRRTGDTAVPTFPQWEIEEFARQCEELFRKQWPITYAAFVECGRVAP